jgi:hypothetical protein
MSAVCPVYPKQQTFPDPVGTSHLCQNRTSTCHVGRNIAQRRRDREARRIRRRRQYRGAAGADCAAGRPLPIRGRVSAGPGDVATGVRQARHQSVAHGITHEPMTTGIDVVACYAARAAIVDTAMVTSTLRRTSSALSVKREGSPDATARALLRLVPMISPSLTYLLPGAQMRRPTVSAW